MGIRDAVALALAGTLPRAGHVLPNSRVRVAGGAPVRLHAFIGYRWAYISHGCDPRTVTTASPHAHPLCACASCGRSPRRIPRSGSILC
jgi:3-(3-hydroxy-phenyl)propionate hydroxylase